jgi:ATP-dependent RNA helicase DeaD
MKFTEFNLTENVLKGLKESGFEEPTDIQQKAIPPLLEGRSLVGQAKTGSGKTLAFGIPILERIDENLRQIQAVIITPTRELAKQIAEEISKITRFTHIRPVTIYGGVSFERQEDLIRKGAQIVVATPGRLLDHLKRGLKAKPQIIVLDEADKMFDMGFYEDVSYILKLLRTPSAQQFMFFGATIPDETISLTKRYMQNPVMITIRKKDEEKIPESINHFYYVIAESSDKLNTLVRILTQIKDEHNGDIRALKVLVFVKTREGTRTLAENLTYMGFKADCINSDMKQGLRERTLEGFESHGMLLVATDVISRGIDIDDVTHVINYDVPRDIESYLHRVGRTGRMGKDGQAITLITPEDLGLINEIESTYNIRLQKRYFNRGGSYNL